MRIAPLASFWFALSLLGVLNGDNELEERTNRFVRERLVPALKTAQVTNIDFDRLRLCHCSKEAGCHVRTDGWVGGVLESLITNETEMYRHTCYTDGYCYQMVQSHPTINIFGCMDTRAKDHTQDFHEAAALPCSNTTLGPYPALWICCDGSNFCANTTMLHLPPMPASYFSIWIIIIFFGCGLVFLLGNSIRKSCKENIHWWYRNFKESQSDLESRDANSVSEADVSTPGTLSTSVGIGGYPSALPPNVLDMLMVLEETSGSGGGPAVLAEVTLGKQIRLVSTIGSGRFGTVFRGIYREECVAVKVFQKTDELSFNKEVQIFETTMLRHPNVLRYIGSDRIDRGIEIQLLLVTEFHEHGSLYDYLQTHVISLETWFSLIRSTAAGLAFLHSAVGGNTANSSKPFIAHRDIKSRNIMVKSDLTCAIGDLGLSFSLNNSLGKVEGTTSSKCGTVRYLAPEMLSETMQSGIFESYLMADVYAFSLVMWEALCRVEDGNVAAREASLAVPYIEWSGKDPTEEVMRNIVCDRKLRPAEDPEWRNHPDIASVVELINTSWNQNPTARFSAMNIRSRLEKKLAEIKQDQVRAMAAMRERESPRKTTKFLDNFEMGTLASRGKVHDQGGEVRRSILHPSSSEVLEARLHQELQIATETDNVESLENGREPFRDEMQDPLLR